MHVKKKVEFKVIRTRVETFLTTATVMILCTTVLAQIPIAGPMSVATQLPSLAIGDSNFGYFVCMGDDFDGDGRNDLIVSLLGGIASPVSSVLVYSGMTGSIIYQLLEAPGEVNGFGSRVTLIGDCNFDGIRDIAVGNRGNFPSAPVPSLTGFRVFSGATGTFLYQKSFTDLVSQTGIIAQLSDLTGDGVDEIAYSIADAPTGMTLQTAGFGRVDILSGIDGTVLWQLWGNAPSNFFGQGLLSPGDLDGDGLRDLLIMSLTAAGQPIGTGNLWAYRMTPTGPVLLYQLQEPNAFYTSTALGWLSGMCKAGDVDLDGVPDFGGGRPGNIVMSPAGPFEIRSGATGAVIRTVPNPVPGSLNFYGALNAHAGDVDGDGFDDVAVGATYQRFFATPTFGGIRLGAIYVISGAAGDVIFEMTGDGTADFGLVLADGADVDNDGFSDLLTGSQFGDVVRLFAGRPAMAMPAGAGNVGGPAGTIDLLRAASTSQPIPTTGGLGRTLVVNSGSALDFWMATPPMHAGTTAQFLLFGRIGGTPFLAPTTLPFGIGSMCFLPSILSNPADPTLFLLASTFGGPAVLPAFPAYLPAPGSPCVATPTIPLSVTFTVQGIVQDSSVPTIGLALTNAMRVIVR